MDPRIESIVMTIINSIKVKPLENDLLVIFQMVCMDVYIKT